MLLRSQTLPLPRVQEKYHTSEARALCMIHAVNKLIPELVPISADLISEFINTSIRANIEYEKRVVRQ